MITELVGNFSLSLALLMTALGGMLSVAAIRFGSDRLLRGARAMVVVYFAFLTVASIALITALLSNDFRLAYVTHYTERALPFGYKLAAFWAGQEGSLLLWAWLIAAMAVLFVAGHRKEQGKEAAVVNVTLLLVLGFFAALMLFAANPFKLSETVASDGHGLNPMLQDPGMVAHPPLLFLGYAGFTIPFAMMIGALVAGRRDNAWIGGTRRWALASWLFLSVGILLGAQWAYVELGWGGYWAWDPVENASLLPWLTGTALLHSIMAQQHRGTLKLWNTILVALTFTLCIFGTYLTRSGVIQSVHSFGESLVGTFFLGFLGLIVLLSVIVIAARRSLLKPEHVMDGLLGREGMFLATNVLLLGMTFITLVGTLFPLISRVLSKQEVSVQPSFYNKVVAPLGMVLVGLMAAGPLLTYGKEAAAKLAKGLIVPGIAAIVVVVGFWITGLREAWSLICAAVGTVVVFNVVIDLVKTLASRMRTSGENVIVAVVRLLDSNHRRYGGQIAHIGAMMIVAGVVGSSVFTNKQQFRLKPNETVEFAGRTLTVSELRETPYGNYTAVSTDVVVKNVNGTTITMSPQKRFYTKSEDQPNTEVAIAATWREDLYVTLVAWDDGGKSVTIQAIVNPLVSWIWIGGVVLTIGGLFGLLPRLLPHRATDVVKRPAHGSRKPATPAHVQAAV